MKKCVKIIIKGPVKKGFMRDIIQHHARQLELEGAAQALQDEIKIVVLGSKEMIDAFIDQLHKEASMYDVSHIEVEPFVKDRDYRGIFRVIE